MTEREELDAVARALERLLRLNASRKVHAGQATAAQVAVSQPGLVLLRRLHEFGPMSLGELAKCTDMDPAATGRQVRQLAGDGLVAKAPSRADARVSVVRITDRGVETRDRFAEVGAQHMADVLRSWTSSDRAALARLIDRLVDDMRAVRFRNVPGPATSHVLESPTSSKEPAG